MWQETKSGLYKMFVFSDFVEAFEFMKQVAALAEQNNHHPKWTNEWNKVEVWLSTHEKGDSVTEQDVSMSKQIDEIYGVQALQKAVKGAEPELIPEYSGVKLYADGGSRGNPGPSASGYALLDQNDKVILKDGVYMGITTNNQAEYNALRVGLQKALDMGIGEIDVFLDSQLVINQMKGVYKVRHPDILPVFAAVKDLARQFKEISFTHVPRELNKIADGEVNRVLDLETGQPKA